MVFFYFFTVSRKVVFFLDFFLWCGERGFCGGVCCCGAKSGESVELGMLNLKVLLLTKILTQENIAPKVR